MLCRILLLGKSLRQGFFAWMTVARLLILGFNHLYVVVSGSP